MLVDDYVKFAAHKFYLDPHLVQSVVIAEGGHNAIIKAVQCSIPSVNTFEDAIDILCHSLIHRMNEYIYMDHTRSVEFVKYMGSKWAPPNVQNDPNHLNNNWIPNVLTLWGK